ncbi:MAG: hypothetical protein BMS9Abin02_0998 [Anaerolineae bacterium]|nr:MAG: hypothetical protein BMS9Abin02_0998 [Anaerolineae bacterium]
MIRQDDLQELLAVDAGQGVIVSLYMNADTTQETSETIKKQARALMKDANCPAKDFKAIENYLNFSHDWGKPGLAVFSSAELDFFRAFPLAIAFRNRIRLSNKPHVKPLAHLLEHYAHYGVIVVDRTEARFFEYHLGELQSTGGATGEDVRKLKLGGGSARSGRTSSATGQRGGQGGRHEEEVVQRNIREFSSKANKFYSLRPIRRLFIGGTNETVAQFREQLSKQLQSQIAAVFAVDMNTGEHELRAKALDLMGQANLEREEKLVKTMIASAAKGGNAVLGLDATLRTVSEGRVQTLIVSDGYRSPGYHHQNSNLLAARQDYTAAIGDDEPEKVEDVVEAAVYRTIEQGGKVEIVSDNSQLEDAGRIGAILRY